MSGRQGIGLSGAVRSSAVAALARGGGVRGGGEFTSTRSRRRRTTLRIWAAISSSRRHSSLKTRGSAVSPNSNLQVVGLRLSDWQHTSILPVSPCQYT